MASRQFLIVIFGANGYQNCRILHQTLNNPEVSQYNSRLVSRSVPAFHNPTVSTD